MTRSIAEIDDDIDAVIAKMEQLYPQLLRRAPRKHYGLKFLASCQRWQAAWNREPDLRSHYDALYRERFAAQQERDERECEAVRKLARSEAAKRAARTRHRNARYRIDS